jgi:pyruvate formate lyase activating enzyme
MDFDPQKAERGLPPSRENLTLQTVARCFSGALAVAGKEMSASQVLEEVFQDSDYYIDSGGGLTLSGGEPLLQEEFCREILSGCREKGISAAVETNLAYDFNKLEKLFPFLDLVMADIKLFDPQKHMEYTGIENGLILENVEKLGATGFPRIIRTPVIPGVNNNVDEISRIAGFIARHTQGLLYYELLNFNPLGNSKYSALDENYLFKNARPLDDADMKALVQAAAQSGIPVRNG